MKIKPPLILLTMILISCAIMGIAGVLAKHTIGKASTQAQNSLCLLYTSRVVTRGIHVSKRRNKRFVNL